MKGRIILYYNSTTLLLQISNVQHQPKWIGCRSTHNVYYNMVDPQQPDHKIYGSTMLVYCNP